MSSLHDRINEVRRANENSGYVINITVLLPKHAHCVYDACCYIGCGRCLNGHNDLTRGDKNGIRIRATHINPNSFHWNTE